MTRIYSLSPAVVLDLQTAIDANFRNDLNPVVLQQVGVDDRGLLQIRVRAYSETEEQVHALCLTAERGIAIILPARNINSRCLGEPGESLYFDGELYHIGVYTSPSYGQQFIHRFQTLGKQDEITWKTSKPQPLGRYTVSCRVKGHTDFGFIQQTTVTHCKLTPLEE